MPRIKALIIDDSALMRQILTEILSSDPEIEVVGAAADPIIAQQKILTAPPDVLTLDVEMPRMNGLTFLEKLMRANPVPVVMVSSFTAAGCDATLRALELGAVDYVSKPRLDVQTGALQLASEILYKVKGAARAAVRPARKILPRAAFPAPTVRPAARGRIIAIGASTGGTEAIREVLATMPPDAPGIVIVQHMPEHFTRSFAARLDSLCAIRVKEAEDGDPVLPGQALLAPGNFHMEIRRAGANCRVHIHSGDPVNRHRPSVDVLFHSCARELGSNVVGVILTGMGADGAKGMAAMHAAGARNIAQNEATCVVFGMPREAILLGVANETLPLERIGPRALAMACALSA